MRIEKATKADAKDIARLIMTAMSEDCCRIIAGEGRTLQDFERMMTELAGEDFSQYSYTNTVVARDVDGTVMGACVSYRGDRLHELREAFFDAARRHLGRDFSFIDDETDAEEYYIDSLAVCLKYRCQGVASALLRAAIVRARAEGLPAGLLVDVGNPSAERLYRSLGFEFVDEKTWGGHAMKHLRQAERSPLRPPKDSFR